MRSRSPSYNGQPSLTEQVRESSPRKDSCTKSPSAIRSSLNSSAHDIVYGSVEALPSPSPLAILASHRRRRLARLDREILSERGSVKRHDKRLCPVAYALSARHHQQEVQALTMVQVEINDDGAVDVILQVCVHRPNDHVVDVAETARSAASLVTTKGSTDRKSVV